ncbi:MAG: TolC family protein, partial [Desulfarculaceae bacterium]|nr:TolC family protein [Desulfarculaceae bacterium]
GKTDFQDVIKIDIRLEVLKEKMITLENRRDAIQTDLFSVLDLPPSSPAGAVRLSKPVQRLPAFSELDPLARQRRQELVRLKTRIDRMTYMVAMGKKMKLPDFNLNLSVYEDRAVNQVTYGAVQNTFSEKTLASRGYGLPEKPFSGVESGWLRQTEKNIHALQEKLAQETSDTSKLLKNAWFEFDKAVREKNLYENRVIDLSKSALTVSKKGYEAGRITFADVIGSYTTWLDVNLAYAEKVSAIGRTRAKIKRIAGVDNISAALDEQIETPNKQDGTQ